MMKQHWMPIAIVVGFAIVLFLVIRDDVLYKQESAKPQKMTPEELEVLRKKERDQRYRKAFVPQQLQEIAVKAEIKRLADWKANFPWKPTHDPAHKFVPKRHLIDLRNAQIDPSDLMGQFPDYNMARWEDIHAGDYHMRLKKFFEDESRFSPQFQQVYEILNEEGRGHNPAIGIRIFRSLLRYKHALTLPEDWQDPIFGKSREQEAQFYYKSMRGWLSDSEWLNPNYSTEEGKAEAERIRDRLVNEVQGMEELSRDTMEYTTSTGLSSRSEMGKALLSGEEEMLVPYEGWYEEAQGFYANQRYHFRRSIEEGDPSLKALMPELFPPVKIKNGVLVDKDGDPVKHFEGANYRVINHKHESFPMPINEEGTIRLPTLEEMEQMRANGQVKRDLSPILGGAVDREMDMPLAEPTPYHPLENNLSEE